MDRVICANLDKPRRPEHLLQARVCVERTLILIRLARGQGFIDLRHYELFAEKLTEIAKMLAGWARA